jgi:hypothetical protein
VITQKGLRQTTLPHKSPKKGNRDGDEFIVKTASGISKIPVHPKGRIIFIQKNTRIRAKYCYSFLILINTVLCITQYKIGDKSKDILNLLIVFEAIEGLKINYC